MSTTTTVIHNPLSDAKVLTLTFRSFGQGDKTRKEGGKSYSDVKPRDWEGKQALILPVALSRKLEKSSVVLGLCGYTSIKAKEDIAQGDEIMRLPDFGSPTLSNIAEIRNDLLGDCMDLSPEEKLDLLEQAEAMEEDEAQRKNRKRVLGDYVKILGKAGLDKAAEKIKANPGMYGAPLDIVEQEKKIDGKTVKEKGKPVMIKVCKEWTQAVKAQEKKDKKAA